MISNSIRLSRLQVCEGPHNAFGIVPTPRSPTSLLFILFVLAGGVRICVGMTQRSKKELKPLMERFEATENGQWTAKPLRNMVGTTGLEPATSTVSR